MRLVPATNGHSSEAGAGFGGSQFVRFNKSHCLDYVNDTSHGEEALPGRNFNYGIYCLNQLLNVIAKETPQVFFFGSITL
jgi:hypothetical protein